MILIVGPFQFGLSCLKALWLFKLKYPPNTKPEINAALYIAAYSTNEKLEGNNWNA